MPRDVTTTSLSGNVRAFVLSKNCIARFAIFNKIQPRLKYPTHDALPQTTFFHVFLRISNIYVGDKIHFFQFDKLCTLEEFPHAVHDEHQRQLNIKTDKVHCFEVGRKATPALNEDEKAVEHNDKPRSKWIGPVPER